MSDTSKGKDAVEDANVDAEATDADAPEAKADAASTDTEQTTPKELSKIQKENKRLRGQISTLQEQIGGIKRAFVGEDADQEVSVDQLQQDIADLRSDLQKKDAELRKNTFIDELKDVTDARKRELKRRVSAGSEDLEDAVKQEIEALDALIAEETQDRTAEDSRPTSEGGVSAEPTQDARKILEEKDIYRKQWGLE